MFDPRKREDWLTVLEAMAMLGAVMGAVACVPLLFPAAPRLALLIAASIVLFSLIGLRIHYLRSERGPGRSAK